MNIQPGSAAYNNAMLIKSKVCDEARRVGKKDNAWFQDKNSLPGEVSLDQKRHLLFGDRWTANASFDSKSECLFLDSKVHREYASPYGNGEYIKNSRFTLTTEGDHVTYTYQQSCDAITPSTGFVQFREGGRVTQNKVTGEIVDYFAQ